MDTSAMWPMNLDLASDAHGQGGSSTTTQQLQQQQQQQQQHLQPHNGPNGSLVFMGATTPGGSTNMM